MKTIKAIAVAALAAVLAAGLVGCDDVRIHADSKVRKASEASQEAAGVADPRATTVLRVLDGDTVAVAPTDGLPATDDRGTEHVVRVLGIDAPETEKLAFGEHVEGECGGGEAAQRLAEVLPVGSEVLVVPDAYADPVDRYGRSLAYVELQDGSGTGVDAGLVMVQEGYVEAWIPKGEPEPERFASYRSAQAEAESASAGSWAQCPTLGRQ